MYGIVPFRRRNNSLSTRDGFSEFENMIDKFFSDPFFPSAKYFNSFKTDIKETENDYIIEAEIPGVKKDDIKIDIENDTLTISLEKNEEEKEEKDNYIRRERHYGSVARSFYLENVEQDKIKADYNDGILTVTMPKAENKQPKRKSIDIG